MYFTSNVQDLRHLSSFTATKPVRYPRTQQFQNLQQSNCIGKQRSGPLTKRIMAALPSHV